MFSVLEKTIYRSLRIIAAFLGSLSDVIFNPGKRSLLINFRDILFRRRIAQPPRLLSMNPKMTLKYLLLTIGAYSVLVYSTLSCHLSATFLLVRDLLRRLLLKEQKANFANNTESMTTV